MGLALYPTSLMSTQTNATTWNHFQMNRMRTLLTLLVFILQPACSGSSDGSSSTGGQSSAAGSSMISGGASAGVGAHTTGGASTAGGAHSTGGFLGSGGYEVCLVCGTGGRLATGTGGTTGAIPCGPNYCSLSQFCCNAACGICGPAGGPCPSTACGTGGASGTKSAGENCAQSSECSSGLLCCYPCGTAGCTNQCMQPAANGQCPMFP